MSRGMNLETNTSKAAASKLSFEPGALFIGAALFGGGAIVGASLNESVVRWAEARTFDISEGDPEIRAFRRSIAEASKAAKDLAWERYKEGQAPSTDLDQPMFQAVTNWREFTSRDNEGVFWKAALLAEKISQSPTSDDVIALRDAGSAVEQRISEIVENNLSRYPGAR
jgi:hypothetical protein